MPPKKEPDWEMWLKDLKANHPTWGAGRITQALEQKAAEKGREDAPKERWVGSFLKKLKEDPTWPQQEREYRTFFWPESMERGDLPWEAAPAVMDLLGLTFLPPGSERPSVRLARWYWRINLICDDLPPYICEQLARALSTLEQMGRRRELTPHMERFLACTPWHSEEDRHDYRESLKREPIPNTLPLYRTELGVGIGLQYQDLKPDEEGDIQLLTDASGEKGAKLGNRGAFSMVIEGMEIAEANPEGVERGQVSKEENNGEETRE